MPPITMSPGRARLIASDCPLTWREVIDLAYHASEENTSWSFGHWLLWGRMVEVGEWLWEYWIDRAVMDDGGGEAPEWLSDGPAPWRLIGRCICEATTASAAAPQPPREWSAAAECPCSRVP